MAAFTVRQGRAYRATISLGLIERFASNETIPGKLHDAGFVDVKVTGSGATRIAEARWPAPDATAEIPSQIKSVVELPDAQTA